MTEEAQQEVTFEQVLQMYEQRLQEQTAIMFALVAKMGGEITLTKDDLLASPEFNTVTADSSKDGEGLVLKLAHQEVGPVEETE